MELSAIVETERGKSSDAKALVGDEQPRPPKAAAVSVVMARPPSSPALLTAHIFSFSVAALASEE